MALGASHAPRNDARGGRTLDNVLEERENGPFPVVPLAEMIRLAAADRISLLKVDIEGSEKEAFQIADAALFGRVDRIVLEYHDNLVPGCLQIVSDFAPQHP